MASVSYSDPLVNFTTSNYTGFMVGPMVEFNLPLIGLGVEAAALYSEKGFSINQANYKTSNIDIPVSLKWKIGLPILKFYLAAGPYFSFGMGNSVDILGTSVGMPTFEKEGMGVGANISGGVELFKRLQVGVNYGYGFTNTNEITIGNDVITTKDRIVSVTAAILF